MDTAGTKSKAPSAKKQKQNKKINKQTNKQKALGLLKAVSQKTAVYQNTALHASSAASVPHFLGSCEKHEVELTGKVKIRGKETPGLEDFR